MGLIIISCGGCDNRTKDNKIINPDVCLKCKEEAREQAIKEGKTE